MKHIELIKTLAVALLFVSMIVLAGLYITDTQRLTTEDDAVIDLDSLLIIREEGGELTDDDRRLVMPAYVCYSHDGITSTTLADADLTSDVYFSLSDTLSKLLGPTSLASEVSDGDTLWKECAESEDFIYIRYHTPIPAPLIYTALVGGRVSSAPEYAAGDTLNILEMFITLDPVSNDRYICRAAARDSDGRVVSYMPAGDTLYFDMADMTAHIGSKSALSFGFASDDGILSPLSVTSIVTDADITTPVYETANAVCGDGTPALCEELLRLFGYNPDRLYKYSESETSTVYVETHGVLRADTDGIAYITTNGTGIELASLLGYESYTANYNIYELLCASGRFIRRVVSTNAELIGGEADIVLTDVTYSDGAVTMTFGLTLDTMLLYDGDGRPHTALRLVFEGGYVTSAELTALTLKDTGEKRLCFGQEWTARRIAETLVRDGISEEMLEGGTMLLGLRLTDGAYCSAEWMYHYRQVDQ